MSNLLFGAEIAEPVIMQLYNFSRLNFTSPYFTAMDCLLTADKAFYCSSALTSGKRRYDEMRRAGINDLSEFKHKVGSDWMQNHIVDVNTTSAKSFTESVRRRHPKALVINPAPLNVPGWGQLEYLAFWEEIIRTRANAVWFNKDWEFSDGCTLEFVVATQEGLPTYDVDGNLLTQTAAEMAIESAINGLDGFDTEKLHRNLQQLRSPTEQTSSTEMRPLGGTQQHINLKR